MTGAESMFTLAMMPEGPLVPPWLSLPLAGLVVLIIATHMHALARSTTEPVRKRIRTATGWLMLITAPLTGYAFGVVSPADPRGFVLTWLAVAGMLGIIIILACLDILNSGRLRRARLAEIAKQMQELQARMQRESRAAAAKGIEAAEGGDSPA